ncbi:MAG: amidohydrolase family protein, partial [Actinomycetota bacterium]|nr:amidohydrolase family protein [Actinomycetota bacterium]
DACHELGVRVNTCYGVTDRNSNDFCTNMAMTEEARRGLEENRRFLQEGGKGMVGIHAAFTCADETLNAAAQLASDMGVGVHVHVAEGDLDAISWKRLQQHASDDWILVHGVLLPDNHQLRGTIVHNPRSNMNNGVGYAKPTRFENLVGLGTDGIGADMLEEFRIGYARLREFNVQESPETVWNMLDVNASLFPECRQDKVTWSYKEMDPWHLAFTSGIRPVDIEIDGKPIMKGGEFLDIDSAEIRAKAVEAAQKLFDKMKELV